MLLIRPLLEINRRRRHVTHTVVFFIFIVSNVGGCLTPLGDPPLFLGYLRGVPFSWTFTLWPEWLTCNLALLTTYYFVDRQAFRREAAGTTADAAREPFTVRGVVNFVWLTGVVLAVAGLVAGQTLPGTEWTIPALLREVLLLALAGLSWWTTPKGVRHGQRVPFPCHR